MWTKCIPKALCVSHFHALVALQQGGIHPNGSGSCQLRLRQGVSNKPGRELFPTHASNDACLLPRHVLFCQVLSLLQLPTLFPDSLSSYLALYSLIMDAVPFVSLDCSMPDYGGASKAVIRTLVDVFAIAYISAVCWIGWLAWTAWLYLPW